MNRIKCPKCDKVLSIKLDNDEQENNKFEFNDSRHKSDASPSPYSPSQQVESLTEKIDSKTNMTKCVSVPVVSDSPLARLLRMDPDCPAHGLKAIREIRNSTKNRSDCGLAKQQPKSGLCPKCTNESDYASHSPAKLTCISTVCQQNNSTSWVCKFFALIMHTIFLVLVMVDLNKFLIIKAPLFSQFMHLDQWLDWTSLANKTSRLLLFQLLIYSIKLLAGLNALLGTLFGKVSFLWICLFLSPFHFLISFAIKLINVAEQFAQMGSLSFINELFMVNLLAHFMFYILECYAFVCVCFQLWSINKSSSIRLRTNHCDLIDSVLNVDQLFVSNERDLDNENDLVHFRQKTHKHKHLSKGCQKRSH